MKGGVYIYRTRKPGARFRIPFLSTHVGYVGQTRDFRLRHQQHTQGGGRYDTTPKPWADLVVGCYRIGLPNWKWLRLAVEWTLIRTLFPVYNVQHNRGNLRRVSPLEARWQRRQRDRGGYAWNFRPAHAIICLVLLVAALVVIGRWL